VHSDANNLAPFSVRVVEVKRKNDAPLKSKTVAPLTAVLLLGFTLSAGLLALSIQQRDGMSLVATALLSLLSSLIGYGNKWTLQLPRRKIDGKVPRGDVVIRYPKGSFLIVRCDEEVARELYFAPAEILSLIGTMMLMGGVICLANAQIQVQIAWAGAYMILGSGYWIVAALPAKLHWDTSCYTVTNECLSDSNMDKKGYPSENDTFTKALWKAIVVSKSISWVSKSDACPDTRTWHDWLNAAWACSRDFKLADKEKVEGVKTWEVPDWKAQDYLRELLNGQANRDDKQLREGCVEDV
jgi:hypothetical protein